MQGHDLNRCSDTATTSFPQPVRPVNSYNMEPVVSPPIAYPYSIEERFSQPTATDTEETIEELLSAILELYEKLPKNVRSQVNLEEFHIPSDKLKDLKLADSTSRGVEGPLGDLSHKLERFKIRTIQLGGVANEEDDKPS
ncbi:hypothetical protein K2173_018596 [Erythroxylum novogranatense]|uniref:Uncharacterized protein n=1 Tax=Erythroxylum novogranatense TaxID=1862640 RepID=A0AAV8UEA8_9ROSI|nr:hypothetical protein K2173_018596 [Erythroxylum novogranatense]